MVSSLEQPSIGDSQFFKGSTHQPVPVAYPSNIGLTGYDSRCEETRFRHAFEAELNKVVPPFTIAKLVNITPKTMVFVGDISIVNGFITNF